MSVHITKTYNIGGLIGLRQNAVRNAAETLGYKEMSLFKFPDQYDTDAELHVRMDGIISALCPNDIVIFQYPSGESPRYDNFLFDHIRMYAETKIIAFVQEIVSQRENSEYTLENEIELLNRSDMFIFASDTVRDYYMENGLLEKPFIIQTVADYMTDISVTEHTQEKIYILAESIGENYSNVPINFEVISYDEYHATETILRIADGGIGLIWDLDEQALGIYMAAGIPVIVKKGLPCEKYVVDNGIGFVAEDFNKVYKISVSATNDSIKPYYDRVKKIQKLFTNGVYTKKLLLDALIMAREKL